MILMHYVSTDKDGSAEYVVFYGDDTLDDAAVEDNARPGFKLKGAWEMEVGARLTPETGLYFLPGDGDVFLRDC